MRPQSFTYKYQMSDHYFRYIDDLPQIPNSLFPEIYDAMSGVDFFMRSDPVYGAFKPYPDTIKFVRESFANYFNNDDWLDNTKSNVIIQRIFPGHLKIHYDKSREEAYNFIIDQGGENVTTCIYDNTTRERIDEICIDPKRWHRLEVKRLHNVKNVTGVRVAVSAYFPFFPDPRWL